MALAYTVERVDAGVEVRLARDHSTRCRMWLCDALAEQLLRQLTEQAEARLRAQMREEYDKVLSRLIALIRAVMDGQPGGIVALPEDSGEFLPFLN